jgi:hypothetical protein
MLKRTFNDAMEHQLTVRPDFDTWPVKEQVNGGASIEFVPTFAVVAPEG